MRGLLVLVFTLLGCALSPQSDAPANDMAAAGAQQFGAYCASCHGVDATGGGPAGRMLDPPPADLTQIAQRNGGRFDRDQVSAHIDGRFFVKGHGPSAMPVWGRAIDDRNENMSTETRLTPAAIHQIAAYLATLQR